LSFSAPGCRGHIATIGSNPIENTFPKQYERTVSWFGLAEGEAKTIYLAGRNDVRANT
jgi:hypothetical protein